MTDLDTLLVELEDITERSRSAAAEARAAALDADEALQQVRSLLRREKVRRAAEALAAANHRERPRPLDRALLERERDAEAVVRALRAAGIRTLLVELDEEGNARVVQLPQGVSSESVRAAREVA